MSKLQCVAVLTALICASIPCGAEAVEKITIHTSHPAPSKVLRITTDVELWAPFGRSKLIADLNPANQDLVRLALEYGGRVHVIEHALLHTTKLIDASGIVILNIKRQINGQDVPGAYLLIPFADASTTDKCTTRYLRIVLFPDDTVEGVIQP
jgi:hypothetical protein